MHLLEMRPDTGSEDVREIGGMKGDMIHPHCLPHTLDMVERAAYDEVAKQICFARTDLAEELQFVVRQVQHMIQRNWSLQVSGCA